MVLLIAALVGRLSHRGIISNISLDFGTVIVLLVAVGGPLLIWWASRPSVMERHSSRRRDPQE